MTPELGAIAAAQGGLVTRRQALRAGCTERGLRSLTSPRGPWVVVRRGVYADRALWDALPEWDRWPLRDRAAHLTMERPHVLSHDSAARAHGLPLLTPRVPLVHVTRVDVHGSRTEHGVKHHLVREPVVEARPGGLPATTSARTALDVTREHGLWAGVVTTDAVLARGVPRSEIARELEAMASWPGSTVSRAALDHADGGSESPGESLARLMVTELGLGRPETQFPVRLGDGVAWCDLRLGCHVIEFDGRVKYRGRARGGVSDREIEDVLWDERQRQQAICAQGLGMSRLVWSDLWGEARARALVRLRRDVEVTRRRFGDRLPDHLESFARTMRGRRVA